MPGLKFVAKLHCVLDFDDRLNELVGGDISKILQGRLEDMRRDMDSRVGGLFSRLAGLTGMEVAITPEVIEKHLT